MKNPSVSKGDSIYFQTKHGPKSGVVHSSGEHGLMVDSNDESHKVYWKHVLGHKKRLQHKMSIVEKGEDGAIVKDDKGEQQFIAGHIPDAVGYLDKLSSLDEMSEGDLVTRRVERELQDVECYMVADTKTLDHGSVLVIESPDGAPKLLKFLEDKNFEVSYEASNLVKVDGDNEESLILIQFSPDEGELQDLVNGVAAFQRQASTDNEMIIVRETDINGMQPATMAVSTISGRSILYFDDSADEGESEKVSVSNDFAELMMKSMSSLVIFKSAVANRPGLALKEGTDKQGHQIHRWEKSGEEVKSERETRGSEKGYGTMHHNVGDKLYFKDHETGERMHGEVAATGNDGAVIRDHEGVEHKVLWSEVTGHSSKSEQKNLSHEILGSQDPLNAKEFIAAKYFEEHNNPALTPNNILKQFPADTRDKINATVERLKGIEETIDKFKTKEGYTAERMEKHNEIIDHFINDETIAAAMPKDGDAPQFTILGGRGGSGKSWFKNKVYKPGSAIVIDADEIKGMLPEYEGWNAYQVHEESGDLFDRITNIATQFGLNIVHDATMKTKDKAVNLVNNFKEKGYQVDAHYMHLPRHEAAKRAVSRFLGSSQRYVPIEVVLANTGNEESFDAIRDLVDNWSFRDNNVSKGDEPILISEGGNDEREETENTASNGSGENGPDGLPSRLRQGDGNKNESRASGEAGQAQRQEKPKISKSIGSFFRRIFGSSQSNTPQEQPKTPTLVIFRGSSSE